MCWSVFKWEKYIEVNKLYIMNSYTGICGNRADWLGSIKYVGINRRYKLGVPFQFARNTGTSG